MQDPEPVRRFAKAVEVGTFYPDGMRRKNGRHLNLWTTTNQKDFKDLVGLLWPWLSERRRERANELLAKLDLPTGRPWGTKPTKESRKRLTPEEKTAIQNSQEPYGILAGRYGIAYSTVARLVQSHPQWTDRRKTA